MRQHAGQDNCRRPSKIATPGDAILARRAAAIELLLKGESAEKIAQKLKITVGTVKGYAAAIDAGGSTRFSVWGQPAVVQAWTQKLWHS